MARKNPMAGPLPVTQPTPPDPNPKVVLDYPVEDVRDFRGGLNTQDLPPEVATGGAGVPESIGDRVNYMRMYSMYRAQFPEVMNLLVGHRGRLELRAGQHDVTPNLGNAVQGLMRFSSPTLTRLLVVAGGHFWQGDETTLPATMTETDYGAPGHLRRGATPLNTTGPVGIASAYGIAYIADGTNAPIKWSEPVQTIIPRPGTAPLPQAGQSTGGLVAPTTAPTAAAGASGLLSGTIVYSVAFGKSAPRYTMAGVSYPYYYESNAGPSATGVVLASQKGSLTGIPVSTDPTVTMRFIYRSGGTLGATPLLCAVIFDNTTTTYTDNWPDSFILGGNIEIDVFTDMPLGIYKFGSGRSVGVLNSITNGLTPYSYYATFYDGTNESNFSPVSTPIGIENGAVLLTGVPTSTDMAVTERRIYRTGGTVTSINLIGTIGDNTTTTFLDNVSDATAETGATLTFSGPGGALNMGIDPPTGALTAADGGGVAPPLSAATAAAGSTGLLDDSTVSNNPYLWYVTFDIGDSILESNPSPVSAPLHLTLLEANLTDIPLPTDPTVTCRRIYRSGGTSTDARLVGTILDVTTTTFTDNIADSDPSWENRPLMSTTLPGLLDDSQENGLNPYIWYVTFFNSAQGIESNPSPASLPLHLTLRQASLTNIPVSTDPQVDSRRIYRMGATLTTIRLIDTISDNVTTTYVDNNADTSLGSFLLDFAHDPPPLTGLRNLIFHKNRLWGHDNTTLYFSSYGEVEYWPTVVTDLDTDGGSAAVDPDAHDPIVGLGKLGSLLLVFREDSVYGMMGDSWNDFALRRMLQTGCLAAGSIVSCKNEIWYLGQNGQIWSWDGQSNPEWQSKRVENVLKAIGMSDLQNAVAAYTDQRYVISIPLAAGGCVALAYDFREDAWSDLSQAYFDCSAMYSDPGITELLLGTNAGYLDPTSGAAFLGVVSAFTTADQNGTPLDVAFRTPNFEWEKPSWQKRLKSIRIEGISVPYESNVVTATVTAYIPGMTPVVHVYNLSASSTESLLLETALHPDLIGNQLYVRIAGRVTAFELHNINLRYQFVRRARR